MSILSYQPNLVSRKFGISQTVPRLFFKKKNELCLSTADYSEDDYLQRIARHANGRPTLVLFAFEPSYYCIQYFYTWWTTYYTKDFMDAVTISQHITDTFSSLHQKFHKGRSKHIKEIQAFHKYFETMYKSNDLSRTICEAAITLKEKIEARLPNLKILTYVEDKYKFTLNYYPPKISPFVHQRNGSGFRPSVSMMVHL